MHPSNSRSTKRPRRKYLGRILCVLFASLFLDGCTMVTQPLTVVDLAGTSEAGYVEFYTEHPKPFGKFMYSCHSGIWYFDSEGKKRGMGAVGYHAGTTHPGPLKDAERLRLRLPPGEHQFLVGDYEFAGGKKIKVPVEANRLTPVVLNCAFGSMTIVPVGGGAYSGSSTRSYEFKILPSVTMADTNRPVAAPQK